MNPEEISRRVEIGKIDGTGNAMILICGMMLTCIKKLYYKSMTDFVAVLHKLYVCVQAESMKTGNGHCACIIKFRCLPHMSHR